MTLLYSDGCDFIDSKISYIFDEPSLVALPVCSILYDRSVVASSALIDVQRLRAIGKNKVLP